MTNSKDNSRRMSSVTGSDSRVRTMLCILALFCLSMSICVAAQAAQTPTDPARTYCVSSGYLYRAAPSINGGLPICSFTDNSWCDVNEFYNGSCGPRLAPNILPSYSFDIDTEKPVKSMQDVCLASGGKMKSVHTPYGDITLCVFPDGTTCDARTISEGRCGMDEWMIYARSWLNAP